MPNNARSAGLEWSGLTVSESLWPAIAIHLLVRAIVEENTQPISGGMIKAPGTLPQTIAEYLVDHPETPWTNRELDALTEFLEKATRSYYEIRDTIALDFATDCPEISVEKCTLAVIGDMATHSRYSMGGFLPSHL